MILEQGDRWHEVFDSLARRWIMTGKARLTYKVEIVRGDWLQYIGLCKGFSWDQAMSEIDEDRFVRNQLARLK